MAFSNSEKMKHGMSANNALESILLYCKNMKYIIRIKNKYRIGKSGYSNQSQFYAPYLISFDDGTSWILYSTTSLRDRIKQQQWDAYNLKEINPSIERAYLIFPDDINDLEKNSFIKYSNNISTGNIFSALDAVVSQNDLYSLIESKAFGDLSDSQVKDKQGRDFETRLAFILSSDENLEKWKRNDKTVVGYHYPLFLNVVNGMKLNPRDIEKITATSNKSIIGSLPTGGNPKTDIIVYIHTADSINTFTISCKKSSNKSVSVHQYTADAFADVLNKEDNNLRTLLRKYQEYGNSKEFGNQNCIELENALKPYINKLALWVLGGYGAPHKTNYQIATHILTYNNNNDTVSIHSTEEYVNILNSSDVHGQFGTRFQWTYASGRKGKSIQLKVTII